MVYMQLGPAQWYVILWGIWTIYRKAWAEVLALALFALISFPTLFWHNHVPVPRWGWMISATGLVLAIPAFVVMYHSERSKDRSRS